MAILGILGRPQSYARTVGSATHVQMEVQSSLDLKVVSEILGSQNSNDRTIGVGGEEGGVQFGLQVIFNILGSP